jgi:hypothetical protein
MTLFDLVCDQVRTPEQWTTALPLDAPLAEVDAFMEERWSDLPPAPMPDVRFTSLTIGDYITIHLAPENSQAELQLRTYRDLLAEVFGIRHPGHDTYAFHITLAYAVTRLTRREYKQAQIACETWNGELARRLEAPELLPPRLTYFADMTHFAPSREQARRNVIL